MRFNTFGNFDNPVIIMLSGSFAPGKSMEDIYNKLKENFYINDIWTIYGNRDWYGIIKTVTK